MKRIVTIVVSSNLLFGCVNQLAEIPNLDDYNSPVEFTKEQISASKTGLIDPYAFKKGITKFDTHRVLNNSWCTSQDYDESYLFKQLESMCERQGGAVDRNWWCVNSDNYPMFRLYVVDGEVKCYGDPSIYVNIIEPIGKPDDWQKIAKENHFETTDEIEKDIEKNKVDNLVVTSRTPLGTNPFILSTRIQNAFGSNYLWYDFISKGYEIQVNKITFNDGSCRYFDSNFPAVINGGQKISALPSQARDESCQNIYKIEIHTDRGSWWWARQ